MKSDSARFIVLVISLCFAAIPFGAIAATLSITPASKSVSVGDTLQMRVVVDAGGIAVNNAEARVTYPTDKLELLSASKIGSVFSLWVEEPSLATPGSVSFNGGVPNPGFSGSNGNLVSLAFRARAAGTAAVNIDGASVRANDGMGTDVLSGASGSSISIAAGTPIPTLPASPAPVEKTVEKPTAVTEQQQPKGEGFVPVVTSSTHPDQEAWYANPNPVLAWTSSPSVEAVQMILSESRAAVPSVSYEPPITERSLNDISDGVWYFNVRARVGGVWGKSASYALRIDTTSPAIRSNRFSYDAKRGVLIASSDVSDTGSGVARYEFSVDGTTIRSITSEEFVQSAYEIPYVTSGSHEAVVVAVDRAGNRASASSPFTVPSVTPPVLDQLPERIVRGDRAMISGSVGVDARSVVVRVSRDGGPEELFRADLDSMLRFSASFTPSRRGIYTVTAEAVSEGGIHSAPSAEQKVRVSDEIILGNERFGVTLVQLIMLLILLCLVSCALSSLALYVALKDGSGRRAIRELFETIRHESADVIQEIVSGKKKKSGESKKVM